MKTHHLSDLAMGVAAIFTVAPSLHFKWAESKPSPQMQAALDELVNAGIVTCTISIESVGGSGGVSYRAVRDCREYLPYAKFAAFPILEPVAP